MRNSIKDVYIYLLLSTKVNEPNIINKIINNAKEIEDKETLQYHTERWETIAGSYFKCTERSPFTGSRIIYSYVLNGKENIYERDRILDYYKETGVSFQIRGLLLDVIKNELLTWPETRDKYVDNLSDESKGMREEDDRLYSPLSKLISKVTQ
ncbi:MAG: hypothetical protein CMH79_04900 [Nitrospinae bacterium]|nr:hypothetical protein [Nitrospinota bacterium]|tara:strand:+ start:136 stop:594 length:459 start_codon:yes stop_codon:yes gene_type:complete